MSKLPTAMLPPDKRKRMSDSKETDSRLGKRLRPSGSTSSILHNHHPNWKRNSLIRPSQSEPSIQTFSLYKWNEISPDIQRVYVETLDQLMVEMNRFIENRLSAIRPPPGRHVISQNQHEVRRYTLSSHWHIQ